MVGARVRRQQVAYAEGRGLSRRRACALLSVARSTIGYVSRLIGRDADVVPPMRTLAAQYPRYGYRTISHLPRAPGPCARHRPDVPTVATGRAPGAEEAAAQTRGHQSTAAASADGDQSRLGVRLRVRHVREWPDAEVPHDHRRIHPRVPRDRCRRRDSVRARHRGAHAARERPRRAALSALGQRPRVRGAGYPAVAADRGDRNGVHRSRQAVAERKQTNPSTGSSAISTCRCSGFGIASKPRSASKRGVATTTTSGRIRVSAI
jgi:hypothetical protein